LDVRDHARSDAHDGSRRGVSSRVLHPGQRRLRRLARKEQGCGGRQGHLRQLRLSRGAAPMDQGAMRNRRLVLPPLGGAVLAALLTLARLPSQEAKTPTPEASTEKVTAWPRASKDVEDDVTKICQELRHTTQSAVFEKLEAQLVEKGPAIAP